jgi:hypothetical protein
VKKSKLNLIVRTSQCRIVKGLSSTEECFPPQGEVCNSVSVYFVYRHVKITMAVTKYGTVLQMELRTGLHGYREGKM